MRAWVVAVILLSLAPAFAPVGLAQTTSPVLVQRIDEGDIVADVGENATATFTLFNLNPTDDFFVSIIVDAPPGWTATATPNRFFLLPRNETIVTIAFEPAATPTETTPFEVSFDFVEGNTGVVTKVKESVSVGTSAPPLILGIAPNPLPPPLDNEYGSFILSLLVWLVLAIVALFALDGVVRALTARASARATTREIISNLRKPLFYFVILFGLGESLAILPRNPALNFVERFALAIAVGVFGLFVLYKVLDSALYYYQREISPRTHTKVDDVLIPVIRKIGVVVLYVVGVILTLQTLGWDPTIIFAGAGIAGLVLAFAAQDTLSNFFGGMFLMLDRPFVDGDVIVLETGEIARVESIGLRTTQLYEFDHHHVITVPNTQLASRRITNYSAPDTNFKVDLFVGVAYGSDVSKVEKILLEVALAEAELVTEGVWYPSVQLREFADSQMTYMLRVTVKHPVDRNRVPSKLRMAIKQRFDAEGIVIPFPQRVVTMKRE